MADFYPEEIEELRTAYIEFCKVKSEQSGSAWGEHYKLAAILKRIGVDDKFESGSQIQNYCEWVITYGTKPDLY